jgi:hypothetical protein
MGLFMQFRKPISIALVVTLIFFAVGNSLCRAETEPEDAINYAYATWIGTGVYSVKDKSIYVLRGPFSYTLREPGDGKPGVDLLFPATLGLHDFEETDEQVGAFTFVPGVELIVPIIENWDLKPFGQFGIGRDFSGSDLAYIYGAGLKSLATFPIKDVALQLGNQIMFADQSQSGGGSDDGFSKFDIGLNYRHPLKFTFLNQATNINLFFVWSRFMNDLRFVRLFDKDQKIRNLYKFGITLGAEKSFSILGIGFRGFGIDITFGENFTGFGLTTGFPF